MAKMARPTCAVGWLKVEGDGNQGNAKEEYGCHHSTNLVLMVKDNQEMKRERSCDKISDGANCAVCGWSTLLSKIIVFGTP